MARITGVALLESCLDSSTVKEISLDTPIDEAVMYAAAHRGSLKYYPHFPRPYFRIERPHQYVVQGIMGNRTLRVTFSPSADETTEAGLCAAIEGGAEFG